MSTNPSTFCFYGCKLDAKTLIWKCKPYDHIDDADRYALSDGNSSMSTKLIPVNCVFIKNPNFLKQILLKSDLAFDVRIE
jgi:hypothetical protein